MSTPVATIADALIEFILSLLRDPEAVAELDAEPEAVLARNNLSDVCVEDVRAVTPVIVERADVSPKPYVPPPFKPGPVTPPTPAKEIVNVANHFSIENRPTIIDQSVNQNIWAKGDVLQVFDQEAVVASGEESVAAGDDAGVDNSTDETTIGDVTIGEDGEFIFEDETDLFEDDDDVLPVVDEATGAPLDAPVDEELGEAVALVEPVEEAPVEEAPVEEAPVEEAPVEEAPVEEAPVVVEEATVEAETDFAPVEDVAYEEPPAEDQF